jgi:hypothetical protein
MERISMKLCTKILCKLTCVFLIVAWPQPAVEVRAEETKQAESLQQYNSVEGNFLIKLPGKPQLSKEALSGSKDVQHQLIAGDANGVYLVSWQESPKLAASSEEKQLQALKVSREGLEKRFSSQLIKEVKILFRDNVVALRFQLQLPEKRGQLHGTFFFANSRLYQIMVIGTDEFVSSQQAKDMLDSFQWTARK